MWLNYWYLSGMQLGIAKRGFILAIDVRMCFRVLEYIETLFFNIVAV